MWLTDPVDDFQVWSNHGSASHDCTKNTGVVLEPTCPEQGDITANFTNDVRKFLKSSHAADKTASSGTKDSGEVGILKEINTEGMQSGGNRGLSQTADAGSTQNDRSDRPKSARMLLFGRS